MRDYYQNRYMGIFFNMPEDKLVETVAENFFAKADSPLLNVLNSNFVEGCVDEFIQNQTIELDLDDLPENQDGWTKPSRKDRRKHDKKASKRKGSAKRFRDRSRKYASWRHMEKIYDRGLTGDWGRRGRRLAETGEVATKRFHHKDFSGEVEKIMESNMCVSNIYYPDGSRISVEMNLNDWYEYNEELATLREQVEQTEKSGYNDIEDYDDYCDLTNGQSWSGYCHDHEWEIEADYDFDDDDDDEIIDEPAPTLNKSSYDTSEFTAMELAQMSMKLACANPDQRAWIREFMKTL